MQRDSDLGQADMMPMETPTDLFVHLLSDMHSAERIIVQMLAEAAQAVSHPELRKGLEQHMKESEQQAKNLEQIFQMLGQPPHAVECFAAEGLAQSLSEGISMATSPDVINGLVVAGGCQTEHLEIAGYTGLIKKARLMGQPEIVTLLQQNLDGETKTLQKLEQIGDELDQKAAQMMGGMQGQADQMGTMNSL